MMSLILLIFLASAQQKTESQVRCEQAVEDKAKILTDSLSRCQWVVPDGTESDNGNVAGCSQYVLVNGKYETRANTWMGSGHSGNIVCGSPYNEQESSYVDNQPMFTFHCSQCTTTSRAAQLEESCIEEMRRRELSLCDIGVPRMRYRYQPGRDPVPVEVGQ